MGLISAGSPPRRAATRPRTGVLPRLLVPLGALTLLFSPFAASVQALGSTCQGVRVKPADPLQRIISKHGPSTTFCFEAGTYVLSAPLRPKTDQRFVAIQRRSAVLTGQDVRGTFAFDGAGTSGVEIRGFVIRRFHPPDQGGYAAVKASRGWRIVDNRIGPNKNSGVYHEARTIVRGNRIQGNTVAGIGGFRAHHSIIANNVIAYNGKSRALYRASGGKWTRTIGIVIQGNRFHHNWDGGLWLDIDNVDALVENNVVSANFGKGIRFEISCSGVIRRNVVVDNQGVGIIVVASRGLVVSRNRVSRNGDAIHVSHQDRSDQNVATDNCRWVTGKVRIRSNRISMARGSTGLWLWQVNDGDAIFSDGRVKFLSNTYRILGDVEEPFLWAHEPRTWSEWKAYGQDGTGSLQTL